MPVLDLNTDMMAAADRSTRDEGGKRLARAFEQA